MSEAFNPDAFLAEKPFDPDAFLGQAAASPEMQAYLAAKAKGDKVEPGVWARMMSKPSAIPGKGETFVNKTVDALPAGRLLTNALSALALRTGKALGAGSYEHAAQLTPEAAAEAQAHGIPNTVPDQSNPLGDTVDLYRNARGTFAQRTAAGSEANPWSSGLGTAFGTGLSLAAPLPKVAVGSGATGRVLSNALTAGGYGALNGFANGKGDLSRGDIKQTLNDTLGIDGLRRAGQDFGAGNYGHAALDVMGAGGIGGALTGGAIGAGMEGLRAAASPLAGAVKEFALNTGRRVLTNGADSLSKRAPVRASAVEEAIRSGAMPAFSNTKSVLGRLNGLTDEVGDQYGQVVSGLESQGARGPAPRAVADPLMTKAAALELETGANKAIPNAYLEEAANAHNVAMGQPTLGLTQSENIKRALQEEAKKAGAYGMTQDTALAEAKADLASHYRQANEDAIDQFAKANPSNPEIQQLAGDFVPVKQRLGNLIEAQSAATRGAARVAQRGHFGLKETAHAAAAVASGHPGLALPVALVSSFAKNRLPSALASGGLSLADLLAGSPAASPASGYGMEMLANALRQSPNMTPAYGQTDEQTKRDMLAQAAAIRSGEASR